MKEKSFFSFCSEFLHFPYQPHRGLCAQDLQEAKDQLLVETADMLMVSDVFACDSKYGS